MAAQDVREIIPRVRRALEGPFQAVGPGSLSDDALVGMTADAIADVILFSSGRWGHALIVTGRDDDTNAPDEWSVDPGLSPQEESMIAAQAAINFFFHSMKDRKVSEKISDPSGTWEYSFSASLMTEQLKMLQAQRDAALADLLKEDPVLARYASILEERDRIGAALLEPWRYGGLPGGMEVFYE